MRKSFGIVTKSVGGLFTVRIGSEEDLLSEGKEVFARARGNLRRRGELLVGDRVEIGIEDSISCEKEDVAPTNTDGGGITVERILPRTTALIRPPMANLTHLFVTIAAASPDPVTETVDKLLCIAEYNQIEPIVVITKSEKDDISAARLENIYRKAGYSVFLTDAISGEGIEDLRFAVEGLPSGSIAAFSGASGVGKSTLLNLLFPQLHLETGEISRRIERGKSTTRCVSLFPVGENGCLFADTPGFTMLDFEHFDFFALEDLPRTFREFLPKLGTCQFKKCTHIKEQGCEILAAVASGEIPSSRHQSYCALFETLKKKKRF